ncbi:hypothetical protein KIN20_016445 [Parelaphostrongylus tenuis]|uniref:Elongator complex protein 4 n=1 Tax=Parelaphostrongylus tenuis TaxID=148309 RepID=A0AAD5MYJ9_PARTN|nr:hypothetical protein KIN20_016445 [Parelaphostrongylus tenuis]
MERFREILAISSSYPFTSEESSPYSIGDCFSETMFRRHADELLSTADIYLQLVAISDEEEKKLSRLEKYHGFLRILRLPRLTSLATHDPPVDLVFTQKRSSLEISLMHLPPALSDDDRRSTKTSCGAVDF